MTPISRQFVAFILATVCALSCLAQTNQEPVGAKTQPPPDPVPFVGCYELTLGRWWPFGFGGDNEYVTPPSRIRLLSERGTEGFEQGNLLIRAMPARKGDKPGRGRPSYWLIQSSSKIDLIWHDGFTGVTLSLDKQGDKLHGWAHAHFDTPALPRFERVTAHRIACDAP